MKVNGKFYSMWGSFVENKHVWIGGVLNDGDAPDEPTEITDITLTPCGKTSAIFSVVGKDFTCACDVQYLGVGTRGDGKSGVRLSSMFGEFTIEPAPGKAIQSLAE